MGFFSDLWKGIKDAFTGNFFGSVTSVASGLSSIGATKRQKVLMDYQDQINDENYARDRADALADYERQLLDQKAMIADERQYNSIGSQMQRARNAGVSPLAALGVSSGSTLTSVSPVSQADSKGVSPTSNDGAQRLGNAMTMITSLSELKLRKEQMAIDKREAEARIQRENAEADKIRQETKNLAWDELAKKAKSQPEWLQQEFENLRSAGKLREAQDLLARAQTKTEDELRDDKKSNLQSQTRLSNAKAAKTEFEDWYQRTYRRTMSNGVSNAVDRAMDALFGGNERSEERIRSIFDNEGIVNGTKKKIFSILEEYCPYLSDQALVTYVDRLFEFLSQFAKDFKTQR